MSFMCFGPFRGDVPAGVSWGAGLHGLLLVQRPALRSALRAVGGKGEAGMGEGLAGCSKMQLRM